MNHPEGCSAATVSDGQVFLVEGSSPERFASFVVQKKAFGTYS